MNNRKYQKIVIIVLIVILVVFIGHSFALDNLNLIESEITNKISITKNEEVFYYETLSDAISNTLDNEETVITLLSDILVSNEIKIPANKKIIIDGNSSYSIIRSKNISDVWYTGTLFRVDKTSELTLKNVVIDGNNNWNFKKEEYETALNNGDRISDSNAFVSSANDSPIANGYIIYNNGKVTLINSVIKNHFSSSTGVFYANNASTTVLDSSTITHCSAVTGGGVVVYTTGTDTKFYVENGTIIDGNYAGANGGVFKVYNNSQVIINDGEIKNNTALNTNGVVAMMYGVKSTFIVNGGNINNNSGVYGKNNGRNSAVYIHSGSAFIMNGGIIEFNHGNSCGGIDAAGYSNASIELNGGTIQNNIASDKNSYRSDLYVGYDYDLVLQEDMKINGNISVVGDLTNYGTINGTVTLEHDDNTDSVALKGTGTITGDVIIKYTSDTVPTTSSDVNVSGDVVPCNQNQVILSFEYNGGIDIDGRKSKKIAVNIDSVPTLQTPIKTGYSVKWYTDKGLTTEYMQEPIKSQITLYAGWIINSHVVTWDIDGVYKTETFNYGDLISMIEEPVKKEHKFIGWSGYTENMLMPDNDVTFVAKWQINRYTIKFETNGETKIKDIIQDYGTIINKPTDPIQVGKTFIGWYIDKELTKEYDFNSILEKDITLYAKWEINKYTMKFETNGGTKIKDIIKDHGTIINKPTDPIQVGKTFIGWYIDKELTKEYDFNSILEKDITLYAKWEINKYTIKFETNGGTKINDITKEHGTILKKITSPMQLGKMFIGWYTDKELTIPYNFNKPLEKDIILYAKWLTIQYTVDFVTNGGSDINSILQDYGTLINKPLDPTKTGKYFIGWYIDKELTIEYDFNKPVKNDIILYAKWEEKIYKLIEGNNSIYTKGQDISLLFELDISLEKIVSIKIDDIIITKENYNIENNKINLKSAYLDTLSLNKHKITFILDDGVAIGEFIIKEKNNDINKNYIMISIIVVVLGIATGSTIIYFKKKNI